MKAFLYLARRRRVTALLCASIFLAGFVLSGCGQRNSAVGRDTLVILTGGDATTFNPIFTQDATSGSLQGLVLDSLVEQVQGYRLAPGLATSWHDTPDHLHWIVQLRRGVRWSDGAPFTSADVVWTWQTQLDPATGFPYLGQFGYIKSIHAEGPYTVVFDIKQPNALFVLNVLGASILPQHILSKYSHRDQRTSDFGEHPIGTGPYILAQWQHDDSLLFKRNPLWWGGHAKIRQIMFRIVFNEESANQAIVNDDAQLVTPISSTAAQELKRIPNIQIIKNPSLYADILLTNHRRPGLNDNVVLEAMMYGWDRAGLANGLYHGNDIVATGIETPALMDWYDPHVQLYPYDPAEARAILEQGGWKLGRDGVRSKNGVRLAYTLLSSDRTGDGTDRLSEFQADMHAIGIAISIQLLDGTTYNAKQNAGDFDIMEEGWGGAPDPDEFTFLDSSQVPPVGNNTMYYKDPAVDRDLRLGLTTIDPGKRKVYYDDMQRRTAEHLPVLYEMYVFDRIAISSRVLIDRRKLFPGNLFYNIGDWRLAP